MTTYNWTPEDVAAFAKTWPCCDIPRSFGWAKFDSRGDLVDLCVELESCEPSGGASEFLDNVKAGLFGKQAEGR